MRSVCLAGCGPSGTTMDFYGLLFATDLWGLTAGKVDQSVHCVGKSVTFVHWEVRSVAGVRLLSHNTRVLELLEYRYHWYSSTRVAIEP